jgi:DNA-binding LytR/AlgR family response regulator
MFQIALCEDEAIFAETQSRLCREILGSMNTACEITVFENAEDFLSAFSAGGKSWHLILMDIFMGEMSGLDLARKIRETDEETEIVFLTSYTDFMAQGYEVRALQYLIKPIKAESLGRLIKKVYEDKYQSQYYVLKSRTLTQGIRIKDIIALEMTGRQVKIIMTDGTAYYSGKLTELLDELPQNQLFRCHSGFAVNMRHIQQFDRSKIAMKNGMEIPISRTYSDAVKTIYLKYMQYR